MSSENPEYKLKLYDYALSKSGAFSSILFSEVFGIFAILALLGLPEVSAYGRILLSVVYFGTVVAIGLTFSRIAYFFQVMKTVEIELGFDKTHDRIEKATGDRLRVNRRFWPVFEGSNLFANHFTTTLVVATIFAAAAWVAVFFHP